MAEKAVRPIIIKKVKGHAHGHHGGAWKVAYADFVTAMMAFFLLLWLLSTTSEQNLRGIADYFTPTYVITSSVESGAEGSRAGQALDSTGSRDSGSDEIQELHVSKPIKIQDSYHLELLKRRDDEAFEQVESAIHEAMLASPELTALQNNLLIDFTPEGLRIQLVDEEGKPMFRTGSAELQPYAEEMLALVAESIAALPNEVSISGHTDSVPMQAQEGNYTNWELSADRANSSRRALLRGALDPARVQRVVGLADQEPLYPEDPTAAQNRRISIILLYREASLGSGGSVPGSGLGVAPDYVPPRLQSAPGALPQGGN